MIGPGPENPGTVTCARRYGFTMQGGTFRKLASLLARREYFEVLVRIGWRCFPSWLIQLRKHYVMVLTNRPRPIGRQGEAVTPRIATNEDLPGILACTQQTASATAAEVYRSFFDSGATCYVIDNASGVVAYSWVFKDKYTLTYGAYKKHNIDLSLPPHCAFIGTSFVHPEWRRRGLYTFLLDTIIDKLEWPSRTNQVLVAVESHNEASLAGHAKSGFTIVNALYFVALFGHALVGMLGFSKRLRIHRLGSRLTLAVNETGIH
jgi:GNAT superfamily N-acetyltransferase